jgi:hypothetical protein
MKGLISFLLIVGGAVHAIPEFGEMIRDLIGGANYIQLVIGLLSIVLGIWIWFED